MAAVSTCEVEQQHRTVQSLETVDGDRSCADFILVTFRKIETNISTARTPLVYLAFVVTNIKLLCNKYVDCSLLY
jgi:hypothetical protein